MSEVRIITCPECGGDGGGEGPPCHFNPVNGDAWGDWVTCYVCKGEKEVEVEVEPIEMEELDDVGLRPGT